MVRKCGVIALPGKRRMPDHALKVVDFRDCVVVGEANPPGNLGLREWIIGVISVAAGYQFDGAVFAGVVDRAVLMGVTLVFGAVGLSYLLLRLGRSSDSRQTAHDA